jgi:peptidoglycan L-alanyl-D-glutamate endopeptidase CwlK
MDNPSLYRIEGAHPLVREKLLNCYTEMWKALTGRAKPRLTYVLRTFAEQDALFKIGRRGVAGERKVTNAKGGQSYHNYGLAFDICLIIDGKKASWDTSSDFDQDLESDWNECVKIAKKHGFEWGGDWIRFKDLPHFQMTFGYKVGELKALHDAKKVDSKGYVIIKPKTA